MNEINAHPLLDLAVLDRYLADEAVPAERAQVEAWLAANPLHVQRLQVLQTLGANADITRAEPLNVDRAWTQVVREQESFVRGRIRSVTTDRNGSKSQGNEIRWRGVFQAQPLRRIGWYAMVGIAAASVLLLIGPWKWTVRNDTYRAAPVTTYTTANGERANIILPDGSHVTLGVASRLDVPTDFAHGNRALYLMGEALFAVEHQGGAPFTVIAGSTTAHVLGTTFLVRCYATDTATIVAVRDGRVAVRSVVLAAQQQLYVGRSGQARVQAADAALFTFATGVLTLDDMTLADAIPVLNRWYDVDIRLDDPALATQGVGGRFVAGSISDLTAELGMTFNVRVVRDGRILTLSQRN